MKTTEQYFPMVLFNYEREGFCVSFCFVFVVSLKSPASVISILAYFLLF